MTEEAAFEWPVDNSLTPFERPEIRDRLNNAAPELYQWSVMAEGTLGSLLAGEDVPTQDVRNVLAGLTEIIDRIQGRAH